MTSIAGVGGASGSQLIQMLQEVARRRAESSSGTSSRQAAPSGMSGDGEAQFEAALVNAGLDASKVDELKSEIRSAVSSALSQANAGSDPRELVGGIIEEKLAQYGVDTTALKEEMQSRAGSMRPPGPPPGAKGPGGPEGMDGKLSEALTAAGVASDSLDEVKSAIEEAIAAAQEDADSENDGSDIKSAVHAVLDKYSIDTEAFDQQMEAGRPDQPQQRGGSDRTADANSANSLQWLSGLFQWIDEEA